MTREEILKEINSLNRKISELQEQLKTTSSVFALGLKTPEMGKDYFYFNDVLEIYSTNFDVDDADDIESLNSFNFWDSEDTAKRVANNIKIYCVLLQYKNTFCPKYKSVAGEIPYSVAYSLSKAM